MSSTHHRTWQQFHVGHLNVTVQLDSTADDRSVERRQELATVARQLITTMDRGRIPTTWAVNDPAYSAATSLILKSAVEHEIALLGHASWVGPTAGRTRFARELARRIAQARCAGLDVTTFAPGVASVEGQIDLVVKQAITAIAGLKNSVRTSEGARALHYHVWEVPVTSVLPTKAGWFNRARRGVFRRIERSASEAGAFHLLIDATAFAADDGDQKIVNWLIDRVATLRDRGLVQIETLAKTAARLSDVPAVSPQRSILRVA